MNARRGFSPMMSFPSPWMRSCRSRLCCVLLPLMLAGCADLDPPRAAAGMQHAQDDVHKSAAILLDGIRLYENGNYKAAIATLAAPGMRDAPHAIQVEALKYTAFSYCVMEDYAACRHAFDPSLALDAGFVLRPSERGHPMWGPVFEQAKAASEQHHVDTALDQDRERWRGIDLWRAR
ncbi:TssQ family T6SS-associated lipoprotein [Massilia forsythiae]|uniref:TssQ family T6SS-associated lipoprotein n=1 Tax=Massilia forsythiae TaxID=2728020 RepID=A0A7Z2VVX0_9BURK|nr:TssQ family T6SS-associated lipoprotein [Massilia forsythiae]QJE00105.1 TssQ family T6SS-associated lipoprotein [Massilia forsythiae]